ncbi:peptide deformylase [Pseudarthrobacter sp. J75]|uniref:peptide deformylase n=1 Tax=unclassified Pseudarthrobacter TaxID=2647000 RepID=UPI002E80CF74|nr:MULTISPECIES: peptide deformylase [unclassified Pseudarthrobacter]MEE2523128.1 peptide deformylase [Pseudarthrobacter sp. J47]MEE2529811.1 peptide deformylase [Pseudarthrobacter sp. J75]
MSEPSREPESNFSTDPQGIRDSVLALLGAGTLPPIVQAGHPALRQPAVAFDGQLSGPELERFIDLMRAVMHEAPGVGLAAPQLGIPLQVAVLEDLYPLDPEVAAARNRQPLEFFAVLNPMYRAVGTETAAFYEGCLSLNGLQAVVIRPAKVELDFRTPDGRAMQRTFEGWQARIVQHETDHLAGTLYIDKAELRSLSTNSEYAARWAEPGIGKAREGLGFLPGP